MDKEKAKEFIYAPHDEKNIYVSKDIQTLLDRGDNELFWIYAVIDTASGEVLMSMDWSYSGEPIIMSRFIHKAYFLKHYHNKTIVKL